MRDGSITLEGDFHVFGCAADQRGNHRYRLEGYLQSISPVSAPKAVCLYRCCRLSGLQSPAGARVFFILIQTCSFRRPTLCGINSKRAMAFISSDVQPASRLASKLLNMGSGYGSVNLIFAAVFAKWNR